MAILCLAIQQTVKCTSCIETTNQQYWNVFQLYSYSLKKFYLLSVNYSHLSHSFSNNTKIQISDYSSFVFYSFNYSFSISLTVSKILALLIFIIKDPFLFRLLTRSLLILFQELKDGYSLAEAYKFVDEIRKREIGRRDFKVILKCEDALMGMSQDPWMEKISKVLEELNWSARDQLNYGIYIFATAKVCYKLKQFKN